MRKLAILSTFVFAFGVGMLITAPTADARPCICEDDGNGDNQGTLVCCREISADSPDAEGVVENLGGPNGDQLTCGSVWIDGDNFVAGVIGGSAGGQAMVTSGCISIGGTTTNDVLGEGDCNTDAVTACKKGEANCLGGPTHGDACTLQ